MAGRLGADVDDHPAAPGESRELGHEAIRVDLVHARRRFGKTSVLKKALAEELLFGKLARGIIVRPLQAFGLPNCLRISTGTDEDNRRCVEACNAGGEVK